MTTAQMNDADVLREQMESGKAPEITRKITACAACRKQKIKCHMKDDKPPCQRCTKRGLSCTINKSLQTILQNDVLWKHAMEEKIALLEDRFAKVADHLSMPELCINADELDRTSLLHAGTDHAEGSIDHQGGERPEVSIVHNEDLLTTQHAASDLGAPPLDEHKPHAWDIVMDLNAGPGAIPGSVVSPVSTNTEDSRRRPDVITRGIITNALAQECLNVYQDRLDHFLYRILGDRRTLSQIRSSSPMLLAAVCSVGALHLASPQFDKCYQEFVTIASAYTFSRNINVDDVCGLCIGAFWLSGISWACIGLAVRMSTELQLHRSIHKAIAGDRRHYLRTRLYYLVYVCDHHFSVPYGRPPMTSVCDAIRDNAAFLENEHAVEDDARLVSQVRFWQIAASVYDRFGADVDRPLTAATLDPLRRYAIQFDNIRAEWTERFARNQFVGNYPRKGVGLHYHFAKLFLYSHAFRGVSKPSFRPSEIALDIDELANSALLSATSILQAVVSDTEIQSFLNGLPTYFDLMIAFAVVFLLKVSTSYVSYVRVDTSQVRELVGELVVVLKRITATMHPRHILASVAKGAEQLLQKCSQPQDSSMISGQPGEQYFDQDFYNVPMEWSDMSFDNFYMGEFDFLSNQTSFGVT